MNSKNKKKYIGAGMIVLILFLLVGIVSIVQKNKQKEKEELCQLGDGIVIQSVSKYSGPFVEDGSDRQVENILCMTVSNTSEKDIQFLRIKAENGNKTAYFDITTLPANATVKVQERSAMEYGNWIKKSTFQVENLALFSEKRSLHTDLFALSVQDNWIKLKNQSKKDVSDDVYVYFKTMEDDLFFGGITYRVKFSDGIQAGKTKEEQSIHYSKEKSKVMYLTYQ